MAEKRYQVFVSSTYRDLVEERQKVAQVLQDMDCIPAGMELFPAIDEEQFEFIKKVVDDCDYYILILGGRYGSLAPDGLSYTEKEFDYALEKGFRVVAFVRENIDSLPPEKRELDEEMIQRLNAFRDRVSQGRLVKFWSTAGELPGAVAVSLQRTIKAYPAPGWIRDTGASPERLLAEINELRKENEQLRHELEKAQAQAEVDGESLASGTDSVTLAGIFSSAYHRDWEPWEIKTNWDRVLYHLAPHLLAEISETAANQVIAEGFIRVDLDEPYYSGRIDDNIVYTIRFQLEGLGLIEVDESLTWHVTPKGRRKLTSVRLIERQVEEQA